MHRRDRQVILFCMGIAASLTGAILLFGQHANGFVFVFVAPIFMWPFGLRH